MKLYACTTYNVQFGTGLGTELAEKVIDRLHNANEIWENENSTEFEIEYTALQELIDGEKDPEVKDALQMLYDEGDKRNDYVHISLSY